MNKKISNKKLEDIIKKIDDQFSEMNFDDKENFYKFMTIVIADFIYKIRMLYILPGDDNADYFKAENVLKMYNFLKYKNIENFVNLLDQINSNKDIDKFIASDSFLDVFQMINKIYDRAYFLKINHPEFSDYECYLMAERDICEYKEIDYLAYFEYLNRVRNNLWGNAQDDYYKAIQKYELNQFTKELAYLFWKNTNIKNLPEEEYWKRASEVIELLTKEKNMNINDLINIKKSLYKNGDIDKAIKKIDQVYKKAFFCKIDSPEKTDKECFFYALKMSKVA